MRLVIVMSLLMGLVWANTIEEFAVKMRYEQTYDKAVEKAQKEGKPLFILMVTPDCKWCKHFEKTVLSLPHIDQAVKKNFIAVIIDRDEFKYPEKYYTDGVPGIFFVDLKKGTQERYLGFQKESAFSFMMQSFLN